MFSVTQSEWWIVFPAGNPVAGQVCANLWKHAGWRVAAQTDPGQPQIKCDLPITAPFASVAETFNTFARQLRGAKGIIYGNDDEFPGYGADVENFTAAFLSRFPDTFGVAQPTRCSTPDIIGGAPYPLVGGEFARRINGGQGAFREEYGHYFDDRELHDVAELLGCFAVLPDVEIKHLHHSYGFPDMLPKQARQRARDRHANARKLYEERKANGFPGHEPISH
jgi:hypothetical protein